MTGDEPDVTHLRERRDLRIPDEDRVVLVDYWRRIRTLRQAVDERLLADADIPLTWTAVPPDGD